MAVCLLGGLGRRAGAQPPEEEILRFSLQESIDYALANNPEMRQKRMEPDRVQKRNMIYVARGLPKVDAQLNYNYNMQVRRTILPDFLSPVVYQILEDENLVDKKQREYGVAAAQFGTQYSGSAGINVSQLIFDANYFVGLKAARLLRVLTEQEVTESAIALTEQCAKAYYLVLIADKKHALSEQNYTQAQSLLSETQALYENGFVEELDVTRLQIDLGIREVELQAALDQYRLSQYVLKRHMGLAQETPIVLTDSLLATDLEEVLVQSDFDASRRIEMSRTELATQLAAVDFKSQRSSFFPTLNFQLNAGFNMGANQFRNSFLGDNWFSYAAMGITLNIPLLDVRTNASTQEKKVEWNQIRIQKEALVGTLALEYAQSRLALSTAVAMLGVQQDNLEAARSVYDTVREKYRQGVGSSLEVQSAMTTLKSVETQYYNALYEALDAKIAFEKACGLL